MTRLNITSQHLCDCIRSSSVQKDERLTEPVLQIRLPLKKCKVCSIPATQNLGNILYLAAGAVTLHRDVCVASIKGREGQKSLYPRNREKAKHVGK